MKLLTSAKERLVKHHGTPALIYFEKILIENLRHFLRLTAKVPHRQCLYSVKAASFPSLLQIFLQNGISGFDASSTTEAVLVHNIFGPRAKLFVTAPALTFQDLKALLPCRPAVVHLDSLASLQTFLEHGASLPLLGIRVNPGVSFSKQQLHESAGPACRLGLPLAQLGEAFTLCRRYGRTRVGLHFHVSCESPSFAPQVTALHLLTETLKNMPGDLEIAHLDVGGGMLPAQWDFRQDRLITEMPEDVAAELVAAVEEFTASVRTASGFAVFFEPGDALVCSAAVLIARVLERRTTPNGDEHLVLDTNINHFPNLLQYGSQPEMMLDEVESGPRRVVISGNSCLGGDHIAHAGLAEDATPEYVTIPARGSYEFSKFNFFNGRFRPDVYLQEISGAFRLLKHDTMEDLTGFWKEAVFAFPVGYQSFLRYEEIAREERGLYLYHPELRHISAFELDPDDFPLPNEVKQALIDDFGRATTTYGRSLGHRDVRERIAAFENGIAGKELYSFNHTVLTLGAANAVWLTLNSLLRGGMRRLLIDAPNFYLYAFASSKFSIPWSNVHRRAPVGLPTGWIYEPEALLPGIQETVSALDQAPDIGAFAVSEPGLPHGCRKPEGTLRLLAEKARQEGWVLIVDETLGDINFDGTKEPDWRWLDHSYPVIRIKSVSKTFGLAGLRLGYLCVTEAARWAAPGGVDLLERMADLSDTAYSSPPSILGPVLCASLDLLELHRNNRSSPGVEQLVANFAKLQNRLDSAQRMLEHWGIHYVRPRSGSSIMAVLHKLPRPEHDSVPFFRALMREHALFLELGPLFSQNPAWDFTVARLGLGRAERDFHDDLLRFCSFYTDYQLDRVSRQVKPVTANGNSNEKSKLVSAVTLSSTAINAEAHRHLYLPLPEMMEKIECGSTCETASLAAEILSRQSPDESAESVIGSLARVAENIATEWNTSLSVAYSKLSDSQQEYDHYFRVRRSGADPLVVHCQSALMAYDHFLRDSLKGHSLQPFEFGHICSALEGIVNAHADAKYRPKVNGLPPAAPLIVSGPVDPLARWRCGHHVFFVLVQRLLVVHAWLSQALKTHDLSAASDALIRSSELWWASATAFRFTADFPIADYAKSVRPSMSPPHVSEGFSGLSSPDHACLLQKLHATRPMLENLPRELHSAHRNYLWAMNAAYESHAYVCECFVSAGASLKNPHAQATVTLRKHLKARTLQISGAPCARPEPSPQEKILEPKQAGIAWKGAD